MPSAWVAQFSLFFFFFFFHGSNSYTRKRREYNFTIIMINMPRRREYKTKTNITRIARSFRKSHRRTPNFSVDFFLFPCCLKSTDCISFESQLTVQNREKLTIFNLDCYTFYGICYIRATIAQDIQSCYIKISIVYFKIMKINKQTKIYYI